MIVGTIGAAVSGFLAIAFLLRLLRTSSYRPFVYYRLVVGVGGDPDHRHQPAPGDVLSATPARGARPVLNGLKKWRAAPGQEIGPRALTREESREWAHSGAGRRRTGEDPENPAMPLQTSGDRGETPL